MNHILSTPLTPGLLKAPFWNIAAPNSRQTFACRVTKIAVLLIEFPLFLTQKRIQNPSFQVYLLAVSSNGTCDNENHLEVFGPSLGAQICSHASSCPKLYPVSCLKVARYRKIRTYIPFLWQSDQTTHQHFLPRHRDGVAAASGETFGWHICGNGTGGTTAGTDVGNAHVAEAGTCKVGKYREHPLEITTVDEHWYRWTKVYGG